MHPLSLHMSAFGPFAAEELIDFSRLGDKPLFLINGPTGSGKTTILDAICFALYGKTTGDEREGTQMRSDLAMPDQLTEVTFTFELASKRYRIRRIPEQPRPKARGDGFTQQSAEAQLWSLDVAGEPEKVIVSSKVTDATREIEQLLGMNADQFRQVMVLPQGKFRQLLTADSKDREHIFSQLFQTQIYKQLEDELKNRSAEVRREVESLSKQKSVLLQNTALESTEALSEKLQQTSHQAAQLQQILIQRQDERLKAVSEKQQATALQTQFEQLDRLIAQSQTLTEQQKTIGQLAAQLQCSDKAQGIVAEFERYQLSKAELVKHTQRLARETDKLTLLEGDFQKVGIEYAGLADLQKQLETEKEQQQALVSFQSRVEKLQGLLNSQSIAAKNAADATKCFSTSKQKQDDNNQRIAKAEQQVTQFRLAADQLNGLQDKKYALFPLMEKKIKAEQLQKQHDSFQALRASSEQKGSELNALAKEKQTAADTLERDWHLAQAAILALTLQDDLPCPVCGGVDHPSPAQAESTPPTQAMLEQARKHVQKANDALITERENYKNIINEINRLSQELSEIYSALGETKNTPLLTLQTDYASLEKQLDAIKQQQDLLNKTVQAVDALKADQAPLLRAYEEAQQAQEVANQLLAEETRACHIAEQEVPLAYRSQLQLDAALSKQQSDVTRAEQQITSLQTRYSAIKEQRDSLISTLVILKENQEQSQHNLDATRTQWQSLLASNGFDSLDDFQQSLLEPQIRETHQQAVDAHKQAVQQNCGALESQQQALQHVARPDLQPFIEKIAASEQALTMAEQAWRDVHDQHTLLQDTEQRINSLSKESKILEERYAVVGTLSDVANGQTGNKVSLQRFVLSVLLDDVLIEASHRLALMSKGRYRLLRKEDRAKGNRASGLDLEVEDGYTGRVRGVATLSGGESFMAALSLALGLSDVVQAYAGGIRLDTLFIDEGFGSLDPESLDLAVRTLTDLQQSGRMVGIISHVAELKEQISARIDIAASERGSKIVWRGDL